MMILVLGVCQSKNPKNPKRWYEKWGAHMQHTKSKENRVTNMLMWMKRQVPNMHPQRGKSDANGIQGHWDFSCSVLPHCVH